MSSYNIHHILIVINGLGIRITCNIKFWNTNVHVYTNIAHDQVLEYALSLLRQEYPLVLTSGEMLSTLEAETSPFRK